ncbi:hypothetical protein PG997_002566 [Apiospora hydei]|uniref:Uncharacterized protein n=1 Tax=Apiospora hydei TaxID=1337664 RepID=A0ABR1WWT2_9PEZI
MGAADPTAGFQAGTRRGLALDRLEVRYGFLPQPPSSGPACLFFVASDVAWPIALVVSLMPRAVNHPPSGQRRRFLVVITGDGAVGGVGAELEVRVDALRGVDDLLDRAGQGLDPAGGDLDLSLQLDFACRGVMGAASPSVATTSKGWQSAGATTPAKRTESRERCIVG